MARECDASASSGRANSPEYWLACLVLTLYGVALFLPAIQLCPGPGWTRLGLECLLAGWVAPVLCLDLAVVVWLSNLFLLLGLALVLWGNRGAALSAGLVALAAGLYGLRFVQLLPEGGQLREGYYVWLASMGALAVGSGLMVLRRLIDKERGRPTAAG
jgi:hypothetical protein